MKSKRNKQQHAYETIRSRILDGTYAPGFRLVIDQLARELDSSAIPVREAIRQLEADGLIQYRPYSGAVVTPINRNEYLETMTVLAVIEGYATALSSLHFPTERIGELRKINQQMQEALEELDFNRFGELNRHFHGLTYEYCSNNYLVENIKQTWNRLDTIRRMGSAFIPVRAKESIHEHEQIITLLEQKKPMDEIEHYVRRHKMNTVEAFKKRKDAMDSSLSFF